jgi:formylmethanofuran dehydrogenase subunit E
MSVSISCLNVGHDFFQVSEGNDFAVIATSSSPRELKSPRFICRKCGEVVSLAPQKLKTLYVCVECSAIFGELLSRCPVCEHGPENS